MFKLMQMIVVLGLQLEVKTVLQIVLKIVQQATLELSRSETVTSYFGTSNSNDKVMEAECF